VEAWCGDVMVEWYVSFTGNLCQSCGASPAILDHTSETGVCALL